MDRPILSVFNSPVAIDDGDMLLHRALPVEQRESVGPFVFLDHYRHHSRRGIGDRPHPHAGIEVISYLLEGGVEHRDSKGFRDTLAAGDAQYIRAGSGMLHAEQPAGGRNGLQLWTSLPPDQKFAEPLYRSFRAADLPAVEQPGVRIIVIAGTIGDVNGPMTLASATTFAVIHLAPGAKAQVTVDAKAELGLYVVQGAIEGPGPAMVRGAFAALGDGDAVAISSASAEETVVALVGGEPIDYPLFFDGPFVMDSPENLRRAERNYREGRMGHLDGVPF